MLVSKKLGNEEITKEFEIPNGLHEQPTNARKGFWYRSSIFFFHLQQFVNPFVY
jgi:hypothetical protein